MLRNYQRDITRILPEYYANISSSKLEGVVEIN